MEHAVWQYDRQADRQTINFINIDYLSGGGGFRLATGQNIAAPHSRTPIHPKLNMGFCFDNHISFNLRDERLKFNI